MNRPLSETLTATLALFTPSGEQSAADIIAKIRDEVKTPAVNNRLERLRKLGLIERRRVGHQWHYRLTNGKAARSPKVRA